MNTPNQKTKPNQKNKNKNCKHPGSPYINLFDAGVAAASMTADSTRAATSTGATASGPDPRLAELLALPELAQIRELVRSQPHMLQPLLEQLAVTRPDVLEVSALFFVFCFGYATGFCLYGLDLDDDKQQ
jgi:hypothetical protein